MRRNHLTAVVLAAMAFTFGVSACGDDTDESSTGTGAAAATATAADTGTTGTIDDSKEPVVVALNAIKIPAVDLLTPYKAGAEAAAKKINAAGGFGGRKVVVESCNTAYQPATTVVCARKSLQKKPVAMIGCEPSWPKAGLPIYAKAEVPSFNCPNIEEDFSNEWSFPMTQGQDGGQRATARYLCTRDDVKTVTVFTQDIPIQHISSPKAIGETLKDCGKKTNYVYYPITGQDLTPYISKAAKTKPDFVVTLAGGALAIQVYKGFAQAGIKADRISGSGNAFAYDSVLKPAGAAMEGAYGAVEVTSWSETDDPAVAEYLEAMKGSGYDAKDSSPQTAYMEMMLLYTAAQKIGFDAFDTASLAEFMRTANDVPVPLTRGIRNPGPKSAPQVKQPYIQIVQWKDGKLNVVKDGTEDGWILAF